MKKHHPRESCSEKYESKGEAMPLDHKDNIKHQVLCFACFR